MKLDKPLHLVELEAVGSTNDHAKSLAKNGYPHGTIVRARAQTAGKGRHGNTWVSFDGNLYMSLVLRPDMNAALTGQLSFLAAVSLAEVLGEILPKENKIDLKWPNDVLLNGKKVAGILLETETNGVRPVNWVVIGLGLNVVGAPEGAVCLKHLGVETTADDMLEKIANRMVALYGIWKAKGFAPIQQSWMQFACRLGETINVRMSQETLSGKFLGIDSSGALLLEMEDGSKKQIASGEVYL